MKTQNINIDLLQFNTGQIEGLRANPRELTNKGYDLVKNSIVNFPDMLSARELIVIPYDEQYIVIGGNQRLRALRSLNYVEAPCKIVDWHIDKCNEFIIKDNVSYGNWDMDLLANEWDKIELEEWGLELDTDDEEIELDEIEDNVGDDEIPDIQDITITKRGDVYILGRHRLMCGDSVSIDDIEKLTNGVKMDFLYTDAPYGINVITNENKMFGGSKDKIKGHKYKKILNDDNTDIARDCYYLTIQIYPDIKIVYWGANYFDFLPPSKCWIAWLKHQVDSLSFCGTELAYTNFDNKHTRTIDVTWNGYNKEGESGSRVHPAQKPILLCEKILRYLEVDNNSNILDLFAGSGSTLISCEKNNRISYNMELDEHYCDVIVKRWQNFTKQDAILENTGQKFNELI